MTKTEEECLFLEDCVHCPKRVKLDWMKNRAAGDGKLEGGNVFGEMGGGEGEG